MGLLNVEEIKPLHDRVLVERLEPEQKGLIHIPEVAREDSQRGRVLACGPGKWKDGEFIEMEYKPGDLVLFNPKWNDFGAEYLASKTPGFVPPRIHLIRQDDIFCKITEGVKVADVVQLTVNPEPKFIKKAKKRAGAR